MMSTTSYAIFGLTLRLTSTQNAGLRRWAQRRQAFLDRLAEDTSSTLQNTWKTMENLTGDL